MSDEIEELWEIIADLSERVCQLEQAVYDGAPVPPAVINVPGPDTYEPES